MDADKQTERTGIKLTPAAANHIKAILHDQNITNSYLYVGCKGGGCSGLTWVLDIRDAEAAPPKETDETFDSEGIKIVCDVTSYVVANLDGTVIDYQESLMGSGFVFDNPSIKHRCGCGSSFSS